MGEQKRKKNISVGLLAHVDAGKTTLTEAMLYTCGSLRKLGRVDHKNAFLDTDSMEKERGITIFSKTARMSTANSTVILLDTPGHVDFSSEMERTLSVLDCAVLVISATDGVQGHTRTLCRLLSKYRIPTFVFVNRCDLPNADKAAALASLRRVLGDGCVDFTQPDSACDEAAAMCDELALEEFLSCGEVSDNTLARLVAERKIYPCYFGSALKLQGVEQLVDGLDRYAPAASDGGEFGAKVFKISRDQKGERLSWLKITGGTLRAKQMLGLSARGGETKDEKADMLRIYSGDKYLICDSAEPGEIVAVTGLTATFAGQGLGTEPNAPDALIEPVLNYRLILPEDISPVTVLPYMRQLEEEDPTLRVLWIEHLREIHLRIMGAVQLDVLKRTLYDRFNIDASFDTGNIVYKETIEGKVEGVGHFEPLRHYAEVHLIIEQAPRGSGVTIGSSCSVDRLELNWQRLIFTHLLEKQHAGVLTGAPLTDVKITLASGRAHNKHTEGGDFRQATYRAVRQGLMQAKSVLLEPFYDFVITLPLGCVGRAMNDIQMSGGTVLEPENCGDTATLTGYAPVAALQDYREELAAYTRGLGSLSLSYRGYEICQNPDSIIEQAAYDPERDTENPADSVFCDHGSGFIVKWQDVHRFMHLEPALRDRAEQQSTVTGGGRARGGSNLSFDNDDELQAIFERTYGKVERRAFTPPPKPARYDLSDSYKTDYANVPARQPEYLLVDGYNIIFAWDELKKLAQDNIAAARDSLEEILMNYQGFKKCTVILVFDAYKVKNNPGSITKKGNIYIAYTKEAETADTYIERATLQLGRHNKVRVATSDNLEQVIILGHGALRLSAEAFRAEVQGCRVQISELIDRYNNKNAKVKLGELIDFSKGEG
ncbi:MAG: TetM/TetW/TetO/TetS family tetracycline resistance ribosomal protection protein [Clostridia bacterium]|nr:TetM/TetW/TetO/TetS family tetracycline resistance ribosomal protection protein [Clostridia bacterium]